MAEQNQQPKIELEREYMVPLKEKVRVASRFKKTPKAVKTLKEFLAKHMKIRDRDLKKVRIDTYLNEYLWDRSIRNPPRRVKVKATKDSEGIVRAELVDYPEKLRYKKMRNDKKFKEAQEASKKQQESQQTAQTGNEQTQQPQTSESEQSTEDQKQPEKDLESKAKSQQDSEGKDSQKDSEKSEDATKKSTTKKSTTKSTTKKATTKKSSSKKTTKKSTKKSSE